MGVDDAAGSQGECAKQRPLEPHTLVIGQLACRYTSLWGLNALKLSGYYRPLGTADIFMLSFACMHYGSCTRGHCMAPHMIHWRDIRHYSTLSQPVPERHHVSSDDGPGLCPGPALALHSEASAGKTTCMHVHKRVKPCKAMPIRMLCPRCPQ